MAIEVKETAAEAMTREIGPGLTREQRSRLHLAHTLSVETSVRKPSKRQKREAEAIIAAVRRELNAGLEETVKLERGRGGHVSQPQHGPVTATDRDGLRSLHQAKSLTDAELTIGLAYRHAFEHDRGRMGSCLREHVGGSAACDEIAFNNALKAGLSSRIDLDVVQVRPDGHLMLHVLRAVAGEGRTIASLAYGGQARLNALARLKAALVIADRRIDTY